MELREAAKKAGYERKLVYKLSYKLSMTDDTWKHAYFENKEEAEAMVKMMEINKYSYISLNKWTWEMFIEPYAD